MSGVGGPQAGVILGEEAEDGWKRGGQNPFLMGY
jgi:hypothetical protein